MKKLANIVYYIRMIFFIIHFYFVFVMLHDVLDMKILGYIFLLFYFVYVIKNIIELLSKKKRYQNDLIYNFMQIGMLAYIMFVAIKVNINGMYVTNMTYSYFKINYLIMIFLIAFILVYSFIELHDNKKKIWKN